MKKITTLFALLFHMTICINAQVVDYSAISVPEESGTTFTKITNDNDCVCMPKVMRTGHGCSWLSNRIIDISPTGNNIAFVAMRNNMTNVFVKDLGSLSTSIQRTNRQRVIDFAYSPNGQYICFSEISGRYNTLYQTDANNGFVCRQITNGAKDYSPVYSKDMDKIYFSRQEKTGISIWSYDLKGTFLSSYTSGMNPVFFGSSIICVRSNITGMSEIWKIDINSGVEECIVSDPNRNFTTPTISPDGKWILFVGSNCGFNNINGSVYYNTDLFACRLNGSDLVQLTYHVADDLSPCWSKDGRHIYFISQRGSANATANIWKIDFNF